MRMIKKITNCFWYVLVFNFIFLIFNCVEGKGPGTIGGTTLSQTIGARPSGVAEAYTAIDGDINCIYYNPAGLVSLKKKEASFTYQSGISDDGFGVVNFGVPMKRAAIAFGLVYYTAGKIELIDISGNSSKVNAQQDYLIILSYGNRMSKNVFWGLSSKVIQSTLIEEFSATALAFDAGIQFKSKNRKLTSGLVIQNIGQKLKYFDEESSLPVNVKLGFLYRFNRMNVLFDLITPSNDRIKQNIGIEYTVGNFFAIRAGYKIAYDLDSLTFGLGIKLKNIQFDYGLGFMGDTGYTHRISLSTSF